VAAAKSIGYAVVGLGSIARDAVLPAFAHSKKATLVAVVSGDKQKANRFAKDFHASHAYS
jgi:predicted dehydrogenase